MRIHRPVVDVPGAADTIEVEQGSLSEGFAAGCWCRCSLIKEVRKIPEIGIEIFATKRVQPHALRCSNVWKTSKGSILWEPQSKQLFVDGL